MTARARVAAIRLAQKLERQPHYAKQVGLAIEIRGPAAFLSRENVVS